MSEIFCYKNKLWKVINHFTSGINEFTLESGSYLLSCHGAKSYDGGHGSHAWGVLNLDEPQTLYAYVGGDGTSDTAGFNGGGYRAGGASDIRLLKDNTELPETYYSTNWITNTTGYEYIKTDIRATGNIRFYCHFNAKRRSDDSPIFGAINGTSTTSKVYKLSRQRTGSSSYGYRDGFFGYYQRESNYSGYHDIKIDSSAFGDYIVSYLGDTLTVKKITTDGEGIHEEVLVAETIEPKEFDTGSYFAIFGQMNGSSVSGRWENITLYNLKFYNHDNETGEETLVGNFVPCLKPDQSEAGLYDTVSGKFYGNLAKTSSTYRFTYDTESVELIEQSLESLSSRIIVGSGAGANTVIPESGPNYITGGLIDRDNWKDVAFIFSTPPTKPEDADPSPAIIRESFFQRGWVTNEWLMNTTHANWVYKIPVTSGEGGGYVSYPKSNQTYSEVDYVGQDVGYSFGKGEPAPSLYDKGGGGGWFGGYCGRGGSSYVYTNSSYRPDFLEYDVDPKFQLTDTLLPGSPTEQAGVYVMVETSHIYENDTIMVVCFGDTQIIQLPPGDYMMKCWGGGCPAGYGGYSEGRLTIDESIKTYLNVGGCSSPLYGEKHDIDDIYHDYFNEDYEYALEYTLNANPTIGFNGGRLPKNYNHGFISGGATDIRINSDGLNSRIIVAGGAGCVSSTGGGEEGTPSEYSGKETGFVTTEDEDVQASFGYGGDSSKAALKQYATVVTIEDDDLDDSDRPINYERGVRTYEHEVYIRDVVVYGYGGGGGWFGGAGKSRKSEEGLDRYIRGVTVRTTSNESYGGSGYVFTEDSYVPSGYALSTKFHLTEASTVSGGNTLGTVTKIEIQVIDVYGEPNRMLCHDSQGFKYFDSETDSWILLPDQSALPTEEIFEEFGSLTFNTDEGLMDEYSIIQYDTSDTTNFCSFRVIPNTLTITKNLKTVMALTDYSIDCDKLPTTDISFTANRIGSGEDAEIQMVLIADINEYANDDTKVYAINLFSDKKPIGMDKVIPDREPSGLPLSLLPVSFGDKMPMRYKSYLCGPFSDESLVEPITNRACCEYNREIFTAVQVKDSSRNRIRIVRLNLVENKSYIVCDLNVTSLPNYNSNNQYLNSILIDDKWLYLNFYNGYGIYRILRSDTSIMYYHDYYNAKVDGSTVYGNSNTPMKWHIDKRHIIFIFTNKILMFDTLKKKYDKYVSNSNIGNADMTFDVGQQLIVRSYVSSSKTYLAAYNYVTETVLAKIQLTNSTAAALCYVNGKFYVTQSGFLNIYNETEEGLVLDKSIITPYSPTTPSGIVGNLPKEPYSIHHANGLLYITMKNNSTLYIYDIEKEDFVSIGLRYSMPSNYSNTTCIRPTTYGKYFFLPFMTLLMMTKDHNIKYNMGYKYTNNLLITNRDHSSGFEYDNRFVTFNEAYMSIHCGDITKEMIPYTEGSLIKKATINKSEYKEIISLKTYENDPNE